MLHTLTCPICNITFTHKDKRTKCCSWECSYIYRSQLLTGRIRGRIHSEEFKKRQSERYKGSGNPHYDKHNTLPKEACIKISIALKGRKLSPETIRKQSEARKGQRLSEETKRKISLAHSGEKHYWFGKHLPESTRQKISKANKGRKCTEEAKLHMRMAIRKGKPPTPKPSLICPICQTKFIQRSQGNIYCSKSCLSIARSNRMKGSNNPLYGIGHTEEAKTKMRLHRRSNVGANNPRWLGGKSFEPYTIEFNYKLKELVRKLDHHQCQLCHTKQNGRKFCVHHIDYDKHNNCIDNLIALCDICHPRTSVNRDYWLRYFNATHRKTLRKLRRQWLTITT